MVQIKGKTLANSVPVSPKCESLLKALRKKKIDLEATGHPPANALLKFLQCQVKATKSCVDKEKKYMNCHKAIMGTGSYNGRQNCGDEMAKLLSCVEDK
mmetsp:Transcript_24124/g.71083  ORF Transcript_24124/g.71083 Transcript_24124/m.71083 type:complete len:99 (+) Transcript_24124:292-588(+)